VLAHVSEVGEEPIVSIDFREEPVDEKPVVPSKKVKKAKYDFGNFSNW
jgi:hypothetical protein